MTTSRDIRRSFLEFFREHGHEVVPSGPLVPSNDPTLMFANAGMVQFKDLFTGKETRAYRRAASAQKCIRISGKHNDLENVGVTARHHTFFEMLGNFSFGDYFKERAIEYAWDFITRVMSVPRDRLVVTVFGGADGVPADDEAAAIWKRVTGFGDDRIVRLGLADNFWQMGDTGPCGPCSEIHTYLGAGAPDLARFGEEPGPDGSGWFEIWNLVFMQFERFEGGRLEPLPAPSIDTGMGLERIAVVSQGVLSNYDTDVLRPIVDLASELSGKRYGGTLEKDDVSMRVLADHARTAAFLIAEGVFPDRDGRPYVLRRVMRRAIRHGHRLGIDRLFFHECAKKVVEVMGPDYPELVERAALIEDVTRQEEERFRQTLRRGLDLLSDNREWRSEGERRILPGPIAFKLYDTYGFPLDLQHVIGEDEGFGVDDAGFEAEMERARERSAGSKVGEGAIEHVYRAVLDDVSATEFRGYDVESLETELVALVRAGERVNAIGAGEVAELVVKATPFYAESGGQVGDRGLLVARETGARFEVSDTVKPVGGLVVHRGKLVTGALAVGAKVALTVDHARRSASRRNHSATHLLHFGLRQVVGSHAMQKGSLVGPDRLRFDYSGSRPLTPEEITAIEDIVNAATLENTPITTEVMPIDEAKKAGAVGIFEERYGDVVRVLRIGPSTELCGGTHAFRTGDIGLFKIVSDAGVAAGVRRIEAATGLNALAHLRAIERELGGTADVLKTAPGATRDKAERVLAELKEKEREIERLKRKLLEGGSGDVASGARDAGGYRVLGAVVDLGDAGALRDMVDKLRDKLAPAVVLLGSKAADGRALLACAVSKDLTARFAAGAIVKEAAKVVGGGGGGRPDFAQAGGPDASKLEEAVARVHQITAS